VATVELDPGAILETLTRHGVDFVLIGGLAGLAHGSEFPSYGMDIAYERQTENLKRLAAALRELDATLRGAPEDVPFRLDARALRAGQNFTFNTRFGPLDIIGDAPGAPSYVQLKRRSRRAPIDGVKIRIASLDHLIAMKEASGRPKDKLMATEYRALSDELRAAKD
jgi:hypothetical protein